jgi:hypothetical protein
MKKALLVCFVLIVSAPLFALGPFKIGLVGGIWSPSNSSFNGNPVFGGTLSFDINKYLAVELAALPNNFDASGSNTGLSKGRIERFPVLLGLRGQYPLLNGKLVPFITIGAGFGKPTFKIDSSVTASWENVGITINESVDNKTLIQLGGGVGYRIIKMLEIGLDFRYLLSSNEGHWSQTDIKSGQKLAGDIGGVNLGGILLGLAIKIVI